MTVPEIFLETANGAAMVCIQLGTTGWLRFGGLEIVLETSQQCDGMVGILADPPPMDELDRNGVEIVPPLATLAACDDEAGSLEHAEVLHDGASVESVKAGAQIASREWRAFEQVKDLAAARIGKCFEDQVILLHS